MTPAAALSGAAANPGPLLAAAAYGLWMASSVPARRPAHPAMACLEVIGMIVVLAGWKSQPGTAPSAGTATRHGPTANPDPGTGGDPVTGTVVSLTAAQVVIAAILLPGGRRLSRRRPGAVLASTCATAGIVICSLSRNWAGLIIRAACTAAVITGAARYARDRRRRSPAPGSLR